MEKFKMEIIETLSMIKTIEAECFEEALKKVKEDYNKCNIVLTADNFIDVEFSIIYQ